MSIDPLSEAKIVDAWSRNAAPWTIAVRERQIENRRPWAATAGAARTAAFADPETGIGDLRCTAGGWVAAVAHIARSCK